MIGGGGGPSPPAILTGELERAPDLVELAAAGRDRGWPVVLFEHPVPDAVSVVALGSNLEITGGPEGADLRRPGGPLLDHEEGEPLAAAGRLWRRFAGPAAGSGPPGTGLVAAGGFAFRPDRIPSGPWAGFPGLSFRVPELAVTRVRGRTFWSASSVAGETILADLLEASQERPQLLHGPPARNLSIDPGIDPGDWVDSVRVAVTRLRAGGADKVVLARELVARGDGVLGATAVVSALRAAYPSCFTYLVSGDDGTALVGASPELLAGRRGSLLTSQPMAGSVARGRDDDEDQRLAQELQASAKDRSEHALVVNHVQRALADFSTHVDAVGPEVIALTNIQHLATSVRAKLVQPLPGLLEVAAALHPTPAVAGHPRQPALDLIEDLERLKRGWYAGAVGWMDARGDGELAITLRCGLLWEDGARVYAGVGVMPDSEPIRELEETDLKLRAILGALGQVRLSVAASAP